MGTTNGMLKFGEESVSYNLKSYRHQHQIKSLLVFGADLIRDSVSNDSLQEESSPDRLIVQYSNMSIIIQVSSG